MATINSAASTFASAASTSSTGASSSDSQQIAGNFQQFLTLLTTQLKNQSPLDPLDTNQFTQQLVQFASVEQQLKTNDTLKSLATGAKAQTAASAAGLVGSTVTVDGGGSAMNNGIVDWTINPAKAAATATLTIKDSAGTTVATLSRTLAAGSQTFTWDGRKADNTKAAPGTYKLSVVARDASGQTVDVSTHVRCTVGTVDMSGDAPVLIVGGARVPLSGLKTIGN